MSKVGVIVCNGEFPSSEKCRAYIKKADVIICCDGGAINYLHNMINIFGRERFPDVIIGDLDSLPEDIRTKHKNIVVHVTDQECNDQTKGFNYILEKYPEVKDIHIIAATGLREDHTIGNISLLMDYTTILKDGNINIDMISDYNRIFAITSSKKLTLPIGSRISIFSPDNNLRIISDGLKWKTDNVVFDNWWKATLNVTNKEEVYLKFCSWADSSLTDYKSKCLIMIEVG